MNYYMQYGFLIGIFLFVIMIYSATHALLNKTDSRAAFGWIALCLLLPLAGPALYFLFGVNRVQERAKKLDNDPVKPDNLARPIKYDIPASLKNIQHISYRLTGLPLVGSNHVKLLVSGGETFPEMISAINSAKQYIYLSTYIFKADEVGNAFIKALIEAKNRKVDVRILIDGIGEYYSLKKVRRKLLKKGIEVKRFLPPKLLPFNVHINLRNHRKLFIVDDDVCYVGGMNISGEYMNTINTSLNDLHFKITGDVLYQIKGLFLSDWYFVIGKKYQQQERKSVFSAKASLCRVIADGPGKNFGHLSTLYFSAINAATKTVVIMTPYFIPNNEILRSLQVASLRGVNVSVILPIKNNLNFVKWASQKSISELIKSGVNVFYQPPPFDHTKIFIVDEYYCLIGSSNIDPRSLRLNYEVCVEIYDQTVAKTLQEYADKSLVNSKKITISELENRPLLIKIRDGIAWLFSPYL